MLQSNSRATSLLGCLLLLIGIAGCGPKGDFATAKVEGVVKTTDGKLIESGKIKFSPLPSGDAKAKAGKPAVGRIKDGKFTLTTYGNDDGAVVGKHSVFLNDAKLGDVSFETAPESKTVTVNEGSNTIEIMATARKRRRGEEDEDDD